MMFTNRYFVRFTAATEAPGGGGVTPAPDGALTPKVESAAEPRIEPRASEEPKPDPVMQQLLQAQQKLDAAHKELETQRAKLKNHEREARKSKILTTLREEFPGLPEVEIRGAALVAAEDGHLDLFAEDPAAAIAYMKTALSPKAKKPAASTSSLGGSPGSPGAPSPTTNGSPFLI